MNDMKVSDLIRELQEVIATRGDLPVRFFDGAVAHPLEVIVALHRTGNTVWIAEYIQPLSDDQIQDILRNASPDDLAAVPEGITEERAIAAFLLFMRARR